MNRPLGVLVALAWLVSPPGAGAGELTDLVAPYLQAQKEQRIGEVRGRAYAEPKRRQEAPTPYASLSLLLLPYSSQFEAQLDAIKAGLRDSLKNYAAAASRLEQARVAYERALLEAGGGELVREGVTDASGSIRLIGVPAGEWLLVAWREDAHSSKTSKMTPQTTKSFPNAPMTVDRSTLTYWRRRFTVTAGEATELTLSDRGVWMTAVREEVLKTAGDAPSRPAGGHQQAPGGPVTPRRRD